MLASLGIFLVVALSVTTSPAGEIGSSSHSLRPQFGYYLSAAEQGDAEAQFTAGEMYYKGSNVSKDYTQAAYWFRKAAEQGNPYAQNYLGFMYRNGQGLAQDYTQAVYWYRKAAEQGLDAAQNNLGYMYRMGFGVHQDFSEAAKWYSLAAAQGDEEARKNLQKLQSITGQPVASYGSAPNDKASQYATLPKNAHSQGAGEGQLTNAEIMNMANQFNPTGHVADYYGAQYDRNLPEYGLD